jgi:acyl carrier protein
MIMEKPDSSRSPKPIAFTDLVALVKRLVSVGDLPGSALAVELTVDTSVDDLGLDSLGKLTLLEELELAGGVELPEGVVSGGASLGQIIDRLNAISGARTR